MSGAVLFLLLLAGPSLLAILLAKRDRSRTRLWGDQPSLNCVAGGDENPGILPVEPVAGQTANRAPVDDISHEQVLSPVDLGRMNIRGARDCA